MYDVLVIGRGPAGLAASINVRQRAGSVLCVGTDLENNPLMRAEKITNYPGFPDLTGSELLSRFTEHAVLAGVEFLEERVLNAYYGENTWMISAGSQVLEGRALVFAGGAGKVKPYSGESEFLGKGVSYCTTCDGMLYRGRSVAVIGFGPAGKKEADYLEEIGCRVVWLEKPSSVKIQGENRVSSLIADDVEYTVDCVFILRPAVAPTMLFPSVRMEDNFIWTDRKMETSIPGLFAAGDCTGVPLQVAKAVGEGTVAGQSAMRFAAAHRKMQKNT